MALSILRQISGNITRNGFFTVMADECTDIAKKEHFDIWIHWEDEILTDHEDVIGLYNVDQIDSKTLVSEIEDVLLQMNFKITQ